jgi:hypothetical protein
VGFSFGGNTPGFHLSASQVLDRIGKLVHIGVGTKAPRAVITRLPFTATALPTVILLPDLSWATARPARWEAGIGASHVTAMHDSGLIADRACEIKEVV